MGEIDEDKPEPTVPPNLKDLNAPLKSFVDFMRIDTDLISVAAENSVSEDRQTDQKELKAWLGNLPEKEKDDILSSLIEDRDPHLGTELRRKFQQSVSIDKDDATGNKPRSVEDLVTKAEAHTAERKRRIAEQKARERARKEREKAVNREAYLNDLAKREEKAWEKVDALIRTKRQSDYDSAVTLLVDLHDLSKNTETMFREKLRRIQEEHSRKPSFVRRLKEAGLKS